MSMSMDRMNMNCGVTRDDEGVAKKVIVAGGRVEDTDWGIGGADSWDAVSTVHIFNIQDNSWTSGKYVTNQSRVLLFSWNRLFLS